jgi:hypothetical protein
VFKIKFAILLIPLLVCWGSGFPDAVAGNPCSEDATRFCFGVEPGERRLAKCLKKHELELSPVCRQFRESRKEQIADVSRTCRADVQTLCTGVTPGGGRVVKCLTNHRSELSSPCRGELERATQP